MALQEKRLSLQEIKEAFPEGEAISKTLLRETEKEIKYFSEEIKRIFKEKFRDEEKDFLALCIKVLNIDPLLEKRKRLKRYVVAYSGKSSKEIDLSIAKSVPILSLFSPAKIKRTSDRSYCSCPLHTEKNSSFCVYHRSNTFYCFGCNKGGDSIKFVQLYNNMSFLDAVKFIGGMK